MYFLHLFHAGGFMMYPLLLCSIIVVAIFLKDIDTILPIVPIQKGCQR